MDPTPLTIPFNHYRFHFETEHPLQKAGIDGIGGNRQRFRLQHIDYLNPAGSKQIIYGEGALQPRPAPAMPNIPSLPKSITIDLQTPLRLKQDGKNLTPIASTSAHSSPTCCAGNRCSATFIPTRRTKPISPD